MDIEDIKFFEGLMIGAVFMGLIVLVVFAYGLFQQTVYQSEMNYVVAKSIDAPVAVTSHLQLEEKGQPVFIDSNSYTIQKAIKQYDGGLVFRTLKSEDGFIYPSLWGKDGQELLVKSSLGLSQFDLQDISFEDFYSNTSIIVSRPFGRRFLLDLRSNTFTDY